MIPDLTDKKYCYVAMETQHDENGYYPSVVVDGEMGHFPLEGGEGKAPLYFGQSFEAAEAQCAAKNQALGINQQEAARMVLASMENVAP